MPSDLRPFQLIFSIEVDTSVVHALDQLAPHHVSKFARSASSSLGVHILSWRHTVSLSSASIHVPGHVGRVFSSPQF